MNILEEIITYKKEVVRLKKQATSIGDLEQSENFSRQFYSLKASLSQAPGTGIIAEYKRKSPSKGIINNDASVAEVTQAYVENGASGLSVLTDERFFGGSSSDLRLARKHSIPILRKDFIIDEYQLIEAKAMGADVVLLIAACLTKKEVKLLAGIAKGIGLEVLLEIHDETELDHICDDADIVGVNNRNLKTFGVDIQTSLDLLDKIPVDKIPVSESGISDVETILLLKKAGYKGFLVGEHFMKQPNPGTAFADFTRRLKAAL